MSDPEDTTTATAFGGWTCDELTPDLCDDLIVAKGSLDIRGIPVHYWKYSSQQKKQQLQQGEDDSTSTRLLPIVMIHGGPGVAPGRLKVQF